jgi:hypothetical protein
LHLPRGVLRRSRRASRCQKGRICHADCLTILVTFALLSEEERIQLSPKMKRRTRKAGNVPVKQGSVAQTPLHSERRVPGRHSEAWEQEKRKRLTSGDRFGEAELLARAATMVKIRALTKANARLSRRGQGQRVKDLFDVA